jgi:hypothetical protein
MRITRRAWLTATAGLVAGCGQTPTKPTNPGPAPRGVELTAVSTRGFDAALAEMQGKVVLVDVWFLG